MKTGSLISGIGSTLLILTCLIVFLLEIRSNLVIFKPKSEK